MTWSSAAQAAATGLGAQLREAIDAHRFDPRLGEVWAALFVAGEVATAEDLRPVLKNAKDLDNLLEELVDLGAAQRDEAGLLRAEADPVRLAVGMVRAQELALVEELEEALGYAGDKLAKVSAAKERQALERVKAFERNAKLLRQLLTLLNKTKDLRLENVLQALGAGLDSSDT